MIIDSIDEVKQSIENLKERNKRLAEEKARSDMLIDMYGRMVNVHGLDNLVSLLLDLFMGLHGGKNVVMYYKMTSEWRYRDIYGKSGIFRMETDPLVTESIEKKVWCEIPNPSSSKIIESSSVAYPLVYQGETIGVIALKERLFWHEGFNTEAMVFLKYAASYLYYSIRDYTLIEDMNRTLRKKNEELSQRTLELERINFERGTMLKEIHHRVKNNLQIICSILSLNGLKAQSSRETKLLLDIESRIRTMGMIHEHLYCSKDLSHICLGNYLKELVPYLVKTYQVEGNISSKIHFEQIHLDLSSSITCGLMVNEIISNSIKYAFKDKSEGCIFLDLKKRDNHCILKIGDDGGCMPRDITIESGGDLGMQLIRGFTNQMCGEMSLESSEKETCYTLVFPLKITDQ